MRKQRLSPRTTYGSTSSKVDPILSPSPHPSPAKKKPRDRAPSLAPELPSLSIPRAERAPRPAAARGALDAPIPYYPTDLPIPFRLTPSAPRPRLCRGWIAIASLASLARCVPLDTPETGTACSRHPDPALDLELGW